MIASPRISVVIPVYNAASTITRTLTALRDQSFADWEAICVDDASDDGSAAILQDWAAMDARIAFIQQPTNGGVCAARNAGIAAARGSLLLFLDSDDWISRDCLDRMIARLDAGSVDIAYCNYARVTADGEHLPGTLPHDLEIDAFAALGHHCHLPIHAFLCPAEAIRAVGGFDPALQTCEDWDLWQRVARMGYRFGGINAVLVYYQMRPKSLSTDWDAMARDGRAVIARATDRDSRLPQGVRPALPPRPDVALYFHLWCVAAGAAQGHGLALAPPDLPKGAQLLGAPDLSPMFIDAIQVGAQCGAGPVADYWPQVHAALSRMLEMLDLDDLARAIIYRCECAIVRQSDLIQPVILTRVQGQHMRLDMVHAIDPPAGVDTLHLRFVRPGEDDHIVETPLFGRLSAQGIIQLAVEGLGGRAVVAAGGRGWAYPVKCAIFALRGLVANILRQRSLRGILWAARIRALSPLRDYDDPLEKVRTDDPAVVPPPSRRTGILSTKTDWDAAYADGCPWDYESAYEQRKYRQTLEMVLSLQASRVLEVGCAEGMFTLMLAEHAPHITACDISDTALARARTRCADHGNVTFAAADMLTDPLPQGQDMTICAELLYYCGTKERIATAAAHLRDTLVENGHLVLVHPFTIADDPDRSGFDASIPFGAKTISGILEQVAGLALVRRMDTELYRIEAWRRSDHEEAKPQTFHDDFDMPAPAIQRAIHWGGVQADFASLYAETSTSNVPVLMYHRVAATGPVALAPYRIAPTEFRAHLSLLRRHGFYTIHSAQFAWYRARSQTLPGRPIILTFDDAYQDFADHAAPLLEAHDFTAELFVVTDLVGAEAQWDRELGEAAPLMNWDDLSRMRDAGHAIGSHLASHRPVDALSSATLLEEAMRSRALIAQHLGCAVESVAAPFGQLDERAIRTLWAAGYATAYTTRPGIASLADNPLSLPRITMSPAMSEREILTLVGVAE